MRIFKCKKKKIFFTSEVVKVHILICVLCRNKIEKFQLFFCGAHTLHITLVSSSLVFYCRTYRYVKNRRKKHFLYFFIYLLFQLFVCVRIKKQTFFISFQKFISHASVLRHEHNVREFLWGWIFFIWGWKNFWEMLNLWKFWWIFGFSYFAYSQFFYKLN